MPLRECMESHTDLERDVFLYWIGEHWKDKTLTHWYLQQIAFEVRLANKRVRRTPKMDEFHMKFEKPKKMSHAARQAAVKAAQSRWCAFVGVKRGK
jgi:hypothetical protein